MHHRRSVEPNEAPVIHSLFHTTLFRPILSTLILGIIQAVERLPKMLVRARNRFGPVREAGNERFRSSFGLEGNAQADRALRTGAESGIE
jgi:hypothetical protein